MLISFVGRILLSCTNTDNYAQSKAQMGGGGSSRPGKGSRVPKNVKVSCLYL